MAERSSLPSTDNEGVMVLSRFPVYRFEIQSLDSKDLVVQRLRNGVRRGISLREHLDATWDTAIGEVGEYSFQFKPLYSWAGERRNRPTVVGSVWWDAAEGRTWVTVEVRNQSVSFLVIPVVLCILGGTFFAGDSFSVSYGALGLVVGALLAAAGHAAESARIQSLVQRAVRGALPPAA